MLGEQDEKLWDAFLEGYTGQRAIRPPDMEAIPLFAVLRQYWLLGLHAQGSRYRGYGFIDKQYLDRHMTLLKALADEASMT